MSKVYPVPAEWAASAYVNRARYEDMYRRSLEDPDGFWKEQAARLDWIRPFTRVSDWSFHQQDFGISWFSDGTLNVTANCLDRHLADHGDDVAILWEPDSPGEGRRITYRQLHEDVCRLANGLKSLGVKKGERVTIYLPMIPEAAVAMLACARIGAIHTVIFGGFSPDSIANRVTDCDSAFIITADEGLRGGKHIPLKANVDEALKHLHADLVKHVIVVSHTGADVPMAAGRDIAYAGLLAGQSTDCPPEEMNAEDPLFILYTSGSTGKPKGVLHATGGYLLWAAFTHEMLFDYRRGDIFWCAADIGWVTGHTYVVYGPLANGATSVMYEGVPNYPDVSRFWQIVDKYQVSTFYGAPTAIRALMREGDEWVQKTSRKSLRLLGSVGEPINPEAWEWYYHVVGEGRCPIVDTWWQTETGATMIAPLPGATDLKPGYASTPFFGVEPRIVDADGKLLDGEAEGNLVIARSWPGQMRTVWGDHERFFQTYFATYPGYYFSGDGCLRDADGDYRITGRVDDVLNVSGHRMGTAEIESALVAHPKVAEAAVVGMPHDLKGQGIYAFATLNVGEEPSEALRAELVKWVRKEIGPIATPDAIQFSPGLPKTRSGKIMRLILRKIAENELGNLGDTTTLSDPSVVDDLVANRVVVAG